MTAPNAAVGRGLAADLLKMADEELFVGHVLTSTAGWGPELEINLAMSSIGQDEIGHARVLYGLLGDADSASVSALVYERPADQFHAAALSSVYSTDWATLVVKHFLYETADQHRVQLLADCTVDQVAAVAERVRDEETYHLDFWTTWFHRTLDARQGPSRVQSALDELWPSGGELFDFSTSERGGLADPATVDEHRQRWSDGVAAVCQERGLVLREGPTIPAATDRILDEMRLVYKTAPGSWK